MSEYKNQIVKVKEWYWIPHPIKVWIAIMIQKLDKNICSVITADNDIIFELDYTTCPFLPLNTRIADDMTSLSHLHEAAILYNLSERSKPQNQRPYTYVSTVLIAVNPLRTIPPPDIEVIGIFAFI
jgi:myosin heavy subunit